MVLNPQAPSGLAQHQPLLLPIAGISGVRRYSQV
uniref:Uncharacterized protein n=1 Tax=Arundo donax TaxID=35708 RepID=A0A0A9BB98_ARUDO